MLVEVARVEVGSSGKVSLSEQVVLVLLAVEAGAVKEDSGFSVVPARGVPSRRVPSRSVPSRRARVRVLEAGQRRINLASGPDSVHGRCGRQSSHGDRGSGCVGASPAG